MDLMSKQPRIALGDDASFCPDAALKNAHLHLHNRLTRVIGERKIGLMLSMYRNSKSHTQATAPRLNVEYVDKEIHRECYLLSRASPHCRKAS